MYLHINVPTYMYMYIHTHIHMHVCQVRIHDWLHAEKGLCHTHSYTYIYILIHNPINSRWEVRTHTHTCMYARGEHIHTHACMYARGEHIHIHMRVCMTGFTLRRARVTYTYIYTYSYTTAWMPGDKTHTHMHVCQVRIHDWLHAEEGPCHICEYALPKDGNGIPPGGGVLVKGWRQSHKYFDHNRQRLVRAFSLPDHLERAAEVCGCVCVCVCVCLITYMCGG